MAEFNLRCQMRYPKKCDLPIAEKERLEGPEKYKVFLMYQFDNNDDYLKDTVKEYFKQPQYFVYDADDIRGLGIKFCKICKLIQACDFGIAVLSPENENVFMEIGLLVGSGKPCLYIVNEGKLKHKDIKKLPFDISDQILIKYDSKEKLVSEIEKEVPLFMPKVQILSGYENALRKNIKERLDRLTPEGRVSLRKLVSYGGVEFTRREYDLIINKGEIQAELRNLKFIKIDYKYGQMKTQFEIYFIEEAYRPILQELLFSEENN